MSHYDYGRCHVCGSPVKEERRDHSVRTGGEWLLIRGVPTGVCSRCGEQILRLEVAERMERIVQRDSEEPPADCIEMPVFSY